MTWRDVVGFPGYQVSDTGEMRSFRVSSSGRPLRASHSRPGPRADGVERPLGCLIVSLRRDGETFKRKVHTLVTEAFIGPRPEGKEVRHIDGDYTNNQLSNLRYGTRSENSFDAMAHGTHVVLVRGNRG